MSTGAFGAVRGAWVGLAMFACTSYILLLSGGDYVAWLLPLCLGGGLLVGARAAGGGAASTAPPASQDPKVRAAPVWMPWALALFVAVVFGALAYGAIATPARAWDGVVAWELKAKALAAVPTLEQPLFADPVVWHHSSSYPLLQPLCLASSMRLLGTAPGRVFFPLLWLGIVAVVGLTTKRGTGDARRAIWVALAVAATPFFVNPSGGGVDSGYGDVFFALAVTVTGSGLWLRDRALLAAAALVLPLVKPEGAVVVLLLPAVLFVFGESRWWWPAMVTAGIGLALDQSMSAELLHQSVPVVPWSGAIAFVPIALRVVTDRCGVGIRGRLLLMLSLGVLGGGVLLTFAGGSEGALGQFVNGASHAFEKVGQLPSIIGGLLGYAFSPRRFGLTFFVLVAVVAVLVRRRSESRTAWSLVAFLVGGLTVVLAAFLLSPELDVGHMLASSGPRLLSHWVGAAWLLVALGWPVLPASGSADG